VSAQPLAMIAMRFGAAALLFILACGKTHQPSVPLATEETLQALESQFRSVLCQRLVECGEMSTQEGCERLAQFDLFGRSFSLTAEVLWPVRKGHRIAFNAQNAEQCLAEIRQASCSVVFEGSATRGLTIQQMKECREITTGTYAVGQSCRSFECEPGSYCTSERPDGTYNECPGTCQRRVPAGGQSSAAPCQEGLLDVNGTCYVARREGESCFAVGHARDPFGCEQGLYCNSSFICVRRGAVGDACDRGVPYASCIFPMVCNLGHCEQPPRRLRLGERCGTCVPGRFCGGASPWTCQLDLGCWSGQCVEVGREGQSCLYGCEAGGYVSCDDSCGPGLQCDASTRVCKKPPGVGEPCRTIAYPSCDTQLFCDDDQVCKAPTIPIGGTCAYDRQCLTSYCQLMAQSAQGQCAERPERCH